MCNEYINLHTNSTKFVNKTDNLRVMFTMSALAYIYIMSMTPVFILPSLQLMGDEPDLDPEISRTFFEGNILKLDPSLLTENGIRFVD